MPSKPARQHAPRKRATSQQNGKQPSRAAVSHTAGPQRLQKVMAAAGIGSRRRCEELILAGRVTVDGEAVRELGTKVDPERQQVEIDGELLPVLRRVYYLVHKPMGVLSTNNDPSGRPRVLDLLPPTRERLFTVGRLDLASEGLILVTNDGDLANRLAHPRYGVEKTYQVLVAGEPEPDVLKQLTKGIRLAEGWARAVRVRVKAQHKQSAVVEIVLAEGRNREVRRLLAKVGHKVLRLKRTAIGPIRLADMEPGEYRRLKDDELRLLRSLARRGPHALKPPVPNALADASTLARSASEGPNTLTRSVSEARSSIAADQPAPAPAVRIDKPDSLRHQTIGRRQRGGRQRPSATSSGRSSRRPPPGGGHRRGGPRGQGRP